MNYQRRVDGVYVTARHRRQAADVDRVIACTRIHGGSAVDRLHVDDVGASPRVDRRCARVRAFNRECVVTRSQMNGDVLEHLVADAGAHAQAGDFRAAQRTDLSGLVAGIIHDQLVDTAAAQQCEPPDDSVHQSTGRRRHAAHIECIVAFSAKNLRRACNAKHIDQIRTIVRVQRGLPGVRACDRKNIAAGTETDVERFQSAVDDAMRHAQARQRRSRQHARARIGVPRSVNIQCVAAIAAVNRQRCADRTYVAAGCRRQAADIDRIVAPSAHERRSAGDRAHIHGIGTIVRIERGRSKVRALYHEAVSA